MKDIKDKILKHPNKDFKKTKNAKQISQTIIEKMKTDIKNIFKQFVT